MFNLANTPDLGKVSDEQARQQRKQGRCFQSAIGPSIGEDEVCKIPKGSSAKKGRGGVQLIHDDSGMDCKICSP